MRCNDLVRIFGAAWGVDASLNTSRPLFMYRLWTLLLLLLFVGEVRPARAQAILGVEWHPPADTAALFADFAQMADLGVTAVRTTAVTDSLVWQRADSLGLTLFQEVNIDRLSAAQLLDTLGHAREAVLRMAFAASASQAVPYIGLARHSDTTAPEACAYFEALTETVRQWTNGRGRTYYLTAFIDDDVCHGAVDVVLLDALDAHSPPRLIDRWQRLHPETEVGLGRLNWRLHDGAAPDAQTMPHTEAWQAHRMRTVLDTLTVKPSLALTFLYRWRDADSLAVAGQRTDHRYGLYAPSGSPRPIASIIAHHADRRPPSSVDADTASVSMSQASPWTVLSGWMLVFALGIGYAQSTTLQQTVQRYFYAHSFYQEAVARSRDLSTPLVVFFAVLVAAANGLTVHAFLTYLEGGLRFWIGVDQLPSGLSAVSTFMLTDPVGALCVASGFTLSALLLWSLLLSSAARTDRPFPTTAALYLILWPCWMPTAVGMLAAMLLASGGVPTTPKVVGLLMGLWVLASAYAFLRTLADYSAVVRPSAAVFLAAVVSYPPLVVLACGVLGGVLSPNREWIWHLMTRS
ncbi:MAG: hypothetical protein AAF730_17150 [Bacteroidota bacterium]